VAILGGADIYVKSEYGVNPDFHLPMSKSMDGWRKVWFFLRNNTDVPLTVFMGSCPVPNPTRGTEWPGGTSTSYNSCARSFNSYGQRGLTGVNLMQTFFSCQTQLLHQWAIRMWMYLGPSCPDYPFSEEFSDVEVNTQIHKALDHEDDLNPWASHAPMKEGVNVQHQSKSACIHLWQFVQFGFLIVLKSAHRVSHMLTARHGGSHYLRMRRGGKRTMPTMSSCRCGDREGEPGVPPGWW
jgi:hypothetical protein